MPDADDFDIEYFRNLMKGGSPKPGPPAAPPLTIAKKSKQPTSKPAVARKKSKKR